MLIVTEPTLSGRHDLERVVSLAAGHFQIPTFVCVNKYDLNKEMTDQIEKFCHEMNIGFVGKIPYDTIVTDAMVQAKTIVEFSDGVISKEINRMWEKIGASLPNQSY